MLTRYVIFEKTLPPAEIIRIIGSNGMGEKEYSYNCDNCDNNVSRYDKYCKSCNRTFSGIADGFI